MGFFDLKATCEICNKEVGLNRFKIKKSNAWICPECFKKAGSAMKLNLSKLTVEEIKEIIVNIEQKNVARNELKITNPLSTADGMYQYCLDNNFGSGWNEKWGVKHFKIIEDSLMSNEEVKMTFIGLHNYKSTTKHDNNFAYAITNKRIMMAQKQKMVGEKFQTVSLDNINDITFESGMLFGTVTIDTIKETFNIGLNKDEAKSINAEIHNVIDKIRNISHTIEIQSSSTISVADEIKKYKELLDIGALTQEEFDVKKKQLLNI